MLYKWNGMVTDIALDRNITSHNVHDIMYMT